MRHLLRSAFVLMLLYVNVVAQPVFLAGNEVRLLNAVVNLDPNARGHEAYPCIAVHDDGSALVTWPGYMQLFAPDLQPVGGIRSIRHHQLASPFPGGRWALVEDSSYSGPVYDITYYYFGVCDVNQKLFRTYTFATRTNYHLPTGDNDSYSWMISWEGHSTSAKTCFLSLDAGYSLSCGIYSSSVMTGLYLWDHTADSGITISRRYFPCTDLPVLPSAAVSEIIDGCFAFCEREIVFSSEISDFVHSRYITVYDSKGNPVVPKHVIDTLAQSESDFSERVTLGRWKDAFILRLDSTKREVMAEHVMPPGKLTNRTYPGIHDIRLHRRNMGYYLFHDQVDMDLEIARLSDGNFIAVWSAYAADSTTDVYTAMLDSSMTMIGSPKRLNADVAGNQFEPQINIRNDTAYVVWLTVPDGHKRMSDEQAISPVSLRSYTVDNILEAERPPAVAGPALVTYPTPVRDHLTLVLDNRSHESGSVQILDVLGRVVRSMPLTGNVMSLQTSGLRPGVFFLRVQGSGRDLISKFVKVGE